MSVTIPEMNGGNPVTFDKQGVNLETSQAPIINDELFEPEKSNAKLLEVQNKGSLAAKVKLRFDVTDSGLQDALWFDFIQVQNDGTTTGSFSRSPMNQLSALADAVEVELGKKETVRFVLVYGMNEEAGNEYQGKTFTADVTIHAKQNTVEQDGFGSDQYDKDAEFGYVKVTSETNLINTVKQLRAGEKVKIETTKDMNITETLVVPENTEVLINAKNNVIEIGDDSDSNRATLFNKGTMTIENCRIINNDTGNISENENNSAIYSTGNLMLKSCEILNKAGINGTYCVTINDGNATLNNCNINATRGGLAIENDATVHMTGGSITVAYYYPVYVYGNGHSVCTDVTFVKIPKLDTQEGTGGNALIFNAFDEENYGDKGSLIFNNCKFKSTREDGSSLEIYNNFKGLTFNDCSFENVTNLPQ